MQEYGVNGQLLRAIKSFYCRPEVCVRVNGKQSKPFHVGVGLRQGCVLSPLLFIVYMNWIDKCRQADECATIGNCRISRLLFADDLVLLSSTESGLQRALNSFADACNRDGNSAAYAAARCCWCTAPRSVATKICITSQHQRSAAYKIFFYIFLQLWLVIFSL